MRRDKMGINFMQLTPGKTNCYLLPANEGYLLIDTGYEADYENFLQELAEEGVEISEINYLLLTHHHDDHAGFVNQLLADCELQIIAQQAAAELLETGENDKTRGGGIVNRRMYCIFKLGQWLVPNLFGLTFDPVSLRDKDILVSGDSQNVLEEIGIDGEILYTPGHTVDSISVLLADGSIFCGDAAANFPGVVGAKYCPPFITDINQLYESWKTIIDSKAEVVYPAHGNSFAVERLKENIGAYTNQELINFF